MMNEVSCPHCGNDSGFHALGHAEISFNIENGQITSTTYHISKGNEWQIKDIEILSYRAGITCPECEQTFEITDEGIADKEGGN